jgi:hypothetical protein
MKLMNRDDWSLAHLFSSTLVENSYAVVGLGAVIAITGGCDLPHSITCMGRSTFMESEHKRSGVV